VRSLAALDAHRVLALVEDADGRRNLMEVNATAGTARPWGPAAPGRGTPWGGIPFDLAVLGTPEQQGAVPWVVVAAHDGPKIRVTVCQGETVRASREMDVDPSDDPSWPGWRSDTARFGFVRFAPCTWAVWQTIDEDTGTGWRIYVHRLRREEGQARIEELFDSENINIPNAYPTGICAGKGDCLAYFWWEDEEQARLTVLSADGRVVEDLTLPAPANDLSRPPRDFLPLPYLSAWPLVWHDELGLLFEVDCDGYFRLRPGQDELLRCLPPELERAIPGAEHRSVWALGHWRLPGGRVLLVHPRGGVILAADGRSVTWVGNPEMLQPDDRYEFRRDVIRVREAGGSLIVKRHVGYGGIDYSRLDGPGAERPLPEEERDRLEHEDRVIRLKVVNFDIESLEETERDRLLRNHPHLPIRDEKVSQFVSLDPDLLAVAYSSGRIEMLSIRPGEPDAQRCRAMAFTLQRPTDMALSEGPRGRFLVVLAGEVLWFDLAPLTSSAGEPVESAG
jgi:hypothetical protein